MDTQNQDHAPDRREHPREHRYEAEAEERYEMHDGEQAEPQLSRRQARAAETRRSSSRPALIGAAVGLLLGLIAGMIVNAVAAPTYLSSTTYGLAPTAQEEGESEAQLRMRTELAQLSFLTPVISAKTTDAGMRDRIEERIGRETDAEIIPSLIPDSNLIFQVQVRATDPQDAYDAAVALQELLVEDPENSSILEAADAELLVVSAATEAESATALSPGLILAGAAAAGALLGVAVVMAYGQRRGRRSELPA